MDGLPHLYLIIKKAINRLETDNIFRLYTIHPIYFFSYNERFTDCFLDSVYDHGNRYDAFFIFLVVILRFLKQVILA